MFGYIYKTTIKNKNSKLFNHFYIGQKQGNKIIESYYGSGKKLRDYFNSHCSRKWSRKIYKDEVVLLCLEREILATAKNIDELNRLEEYYVNKELDNPLCMNLMTGGYGRIVKKEVIDQMSQKKINSHMHWWTNGKKVIMSTEKPGEDYRLGRDLDGYSWFNNGIHNVYAKECPGDDFKPGTIPTTIGKEPWNKKHNKINQKKSRKGIHNSPKTEFKKGLIPWNKNTKGKVKANKGSFHGEHKGTMWYNNGIKNIRSFTKPDGDEWVKGMLPQKNKK